MANPESETPRDDFGDPIDSGTNNQAAGVADTINFPEPSKRGRKPLPRDANGNIIRSNKKEGVSMGGTASSKDSDKIEQAKFLGTAFVSLVELAETFVHNGCTNKIAKKRPEKLDEFKELAAKMGLQKGDRDMMCNSIEKIALRHDWMTKFAPEVILAVSLGQYSMRQAALVKFVNSVTASPNKEAVVSVSQ